MHPSYSQPYKMERKGKPAGSQRSPASEGCPRREGKQRVRTKLVCGTNHTEAIVHTRIRTDSHSTFCGGHSSVHSAQVVSSRDAVDRRGRGDASGSASGSCRHRTAS